MASEDSGLAKLDAALAGLFADWSVYSTILATLIAVSISYVLFFSKEPDVHPYLLARQAVEAPVRLPGESAVLRAHDVPHGYPLKSGLGVKDPNTPKWTSGRNGDLRDIWRAAVRGSLNADGTPTGKQGKVYTVLGKNIQERKLDDISKEINILGQYVQESGLKTVAVSLCDSIELLTAIFAGAFYGFKIVLIPHGLPSRTLTEHLEQSKAELLIAEAGVVDLEVLLDAPGLKGIVWVAKAGNRHMEWSQVPEGVGGTLEIAEWHELCDEKKGSVASQLPATDLTVPPPALVTLWATSPNTQTFIEYSAENLVAGIAALGAALPRGERLTSSDLLLSIDSLYRSYPLCLVLAALYVNASVALTSVAGEGVNFALATATISPTLIVASSHTMSKYHTEYMAPHTGPIAKLGRFFQRQSLDAGVMPQHNLLTQLANIGPTSELSLDKLRLLFVSHRVDGDPQRQLTSDQLTDLRIFTGARVAYALTAPTVAGAISQTNPCDYRQHAGFSHFGPPVSSVEVKLTNHKEESGKDRAAEGDLFVAGPSVVCGETSLGVRARYQDDYTLALA
ncbi:hypothetical protein AJ80_01159 [Polytolypa hystricis UAMH7299]|uniref:Uncharacterized protein n=1 Tax=Polytolypa hystricis (strain UAMH7299) TaxID=1447883 RepID=A0A2B7Z2A5_POLH7|nr:hypothetical protein AJ80_01159 [Polytolypa hystricis UAMH7299]